MSESVSRRELIGAAAAAADGSRVEAEFEDSGAGIAADVIDRLFQPFVTTKPDGLGVGLSIRRSIVEHRGGRLRAANNPAGGATFTEAAAIDTCSGLGGGSRLAWDVDRGNRREEQAGR